MKRTLRIVFLTSTKQRNLFLCRRPIILGLSKWHASRAVKENAIYHNCVVFSYAFRFMLIYTVLIRIWANAAASAAAASV